MAFSHQRFTQLDSPVCHVKNHNHVCGLLLPQGPKSSSLNFGPCQSLAGARLHQVKSCHLCRSSSGEKITRQLVSLHTCSDIIYLPAAKSKTPSLPSCQISLQVCRSLLPSAVSSTTWGEAMDTLIVPCITSTWPCASHDMAIQSPIKATLLAAHVPNKTHTKSSRSHQELRNQSRGFMRFFKISKASLICCIRSQFPCLSGCCRFDSSLYFCVTSFHVAF